MTAAVKKLIKYTPNEVRTSQILEKILFARRRPSEDGYFKRFAVAIFENDLVRSKIGLCVQSTQVFLSYSKQMLSKWGKEKIEEYNINVHTEEPKHIIDEAGPTIRCYQSPLSC